MAAASPEMNFRKKALLLVGTLLSGVVTGGMVTQLPIAQATITSSVLLASLVLVFASASRRTVWWVGVGGTTGMIIGLGGIMSEHLAAEKEPLALHLRLVLVVSQTLAGLISGVLVGRRLPHAHRPTLKDFLSSLSAVTVGLFAVVVTGRFIVDGLEPACTLSIRLSASTKILITLLAIPGASAPDSGSDRHKHHQGSDRLPSSESGGPIATDRGATMHQLHTCPDPTP